MKNLKEKNCMKCHFELILLTVNRRLTEANINRSESVLKNTDINTEKKKKLNN